MNNFVGRANALVDQGDVEQAEAVFEEALRRLPDNLDSLVGYAWTAVLQQRWVEALQRWRRVLEVYPGNLRARLGLGNALLELGDPDQAEAVFETLEDIGAAGKPRPINPRGDLAEYEWTTTGWQFVGGPGLGDPVPGQAFVRFGFNEFDYDQVFDRNGISRNSDGWHGDAAVTVAVPVGPPPTPPSPSRCFRTLSA